MAICWFVTFVVLLFIELATVNLVSIWFAVGAIVAMITAYFVDSVMIQTFVFIIVSLVTLLIIKPVVKKFKINKVEATNLDRVIGKTGVVTKEISASNYGEVKVLGSVWTAVSDEVIESGTKVVVKKIDGVKLLVNKEERE